MSGNLRRSHKLVQASADLYVMASQCEIAKVQFVPSVQIFAHFYLDLEHILVNFCKNVLV
jgi:hypothetical protein